MIIILKNLIADYNVYSLLPKAYKTSYKPLLLPINTLLAAKKRDEGMIIFDFFLGGMGRRGPSCKDVTSFQFKTSPDDDYDDDDDTVTSLYNQKTQPHHVPTPKCMFNR